MADSNLNEINGVPLYQPGDPYHHDFDNKPIKSLVDRDNVILGVVNSLKAIIDTAGGNLDLSTRLGQSIDPQGNLRSSAIDESNHNIANHLDGRKQITQQELEYYVSLGYEVTRNPKFVRFLEEERAKLSLISDEANKLFVSISPDNDQKHVIDNGEVNFQSSDTVGVSVDSNNVVRFNNKFPSSAAHRHHYQIEPVSNNLKDYSINGVSSFKQGSLRVYVNGMRIEQCSSDCDNINIGFYPSFSSSSGSVSVVWSKLYFVENSGSGIFSFSKTLSQTDRVLVDYDLLLN